MVCLLDAHRDQAQNIRYETPFQTMPAISTETYVDTFGNHVRRFIAPAGDLTIRRDAIIENSGQPDPVELNAEEIAVERLPNDTLVFTLGSRYCETDKLSDIAWQLFGSTFRGWRRVQIGHGRLLWVVDYGFCKTAAPFGAEGAPAPAGAPPLVGVPGAGGPPAPPCSPVSST